MSKEKLNNDEFEDIGNPFDEEFSRDDVVNSGDELASDSDNLVNDLFNDNDLNDISQSGAEAKKAADFFKSVNDDDRGTIIKKVDAELSDEIEDLDLEKILSEDREELKKELFKDIDKKEEAKEIKDKEDFFDDSDIPNPDDKYRSEINDKFKDFIQAPRITGKEKSSFTKNLIPNEAIASNNHTIEISDDPNSYLESEEQDHSTSVEINRDDFGEIESIVINCKCGEKTLIEFNYNDDRDTELTETHNEKVKEKPLREED